MAASHRHVFVVTRRQRLGGAPFVKQCACGRTWRHHRGRWVLTAPGQVGETMAWADTLREGREHVARLAQS